MRLMFCKKNLQSRGIGEDKEGNPNAQSKLSSVDTLRFCF